MSDKLQGVSLGEQDFVSILQNVISKGNVKKEVNIEVKGAKDIDKVNAALEKFSSINTDNVINQLEVIDNLLTKRFKGVNLNQFTAKLIQALQDPSKSAEDLSNAINDVYDNLTTLASVSNSGSFTGFNESEIRKTIKKQKEILELKEQLESEGNAARAKAARQKPVDILTRANVEKIQKKSSSDVATSLGVDSSKINVKNGDDSLLQTYQQTADLLAKMVSERKEYNKLNKANVGDYLKQEQDILSVFQQLQEIEKQITEKFGISSQNLLSNQFKGDNGQFDFVERARKAVNAYVTQMTSGTQKALQSAQNKLASQLESAATKSVDRLGQANEKVGKTRERLGSPRVGSGGDATVQPGAEIGESVAAGMEKSEKATDAATESIKKYILSAEETRDALRGIIDQIEELEAKKQLTSKEENDLDQAYADGAKYLANFERLGYPKDKIGTILGRNLEGDNWADVINTMKPDSSKFEEEVQRIKSYVQSEPITVEIVPEIQSRDDIEEVRRLEERSIVVDIKSDGIYQAIKNIDQLSKTTNKELGVFFSSQTGIAGDIFEGDNSKKISGGQINTNRFNYRKQTGQYADTLYHTHPESTVAVLSDDDIKNSIQYVKDGLRYVVAQAGEQIASIDVKSLIESGFDASKYIDSRKNYTELGLTQLKSDKLSNINYSVFGQDIPDWELQFKNISQNFLNTNFEFLDGVSVEFDENVKTVLQSYFDTMLNRIRQKIQNGAQLESASFIENSMQDMEDSVRQQLTSLINKDTLNVDPERIGDIISELYYNIESVFKQSQSFLNAVKTTKEERQLVAQNAISSALRDQGIDPSSVYKVQSRQDYLSSIYSPDTVGGQNREYNNTGIDTHKDKVRELRNELEETKQPLQIILDYLSQLNTQSLGGLVDDFNKLPESIKTAANELGLLNEEKNGFNISANGGENHGVIIGENTLISRTGSQTKYEEVLRLKEALDQAAESGINVSRILGVVFDSEKNTLLELQKTAPGDVISNIPLNGESSENLKFNEALLQATDEQIIKLIRDIESLNSLGINVDFNDSNFLYDKTNGFSIIDLKMKDAKSSNYGSDDLLDMFSYIKSEFDYAGKDTSAIDVFIERIKTAIVLKEELQKSGGNTELFRTAESEEKINTIKTELQSLREELQRFKDTGVEPDGIADLQTKLEDARQRAESLSDELSILYSNSVDTSTYIQLEEELREAQADADALRQELENIKNIGASTGAETATDVLRQQEEAANAAANAAQASSQADQQATDAAQARTDANNALAESERAVAQAESAQSGTTAESSAQSDRQAAEAAEQRAQANEHLAQSELNVGTSESARLGNNTSSNATDATIIGATVDAEITKLNELKDKIATDIPQAIGVKNNAFRDEQSVVESVVSAEINALTRLEGGLKGVTEAAKNKTKAFQEQPKNVGGQTSASGSQKTNTKKEPTEQEKRDQEDAASLKQYNLALTEYLKLENQRIILAKKGTVELSAEQEEKRIGYLKQMDSIQEKWNATQDHSNKLLDEYNRLFNKRSSSEQSTDTYYRANYNEYAKSFTHYGQRLTTINSLLNEKELRPEAFGKAMDDLVKKGEELQKLFPLNPTDQEGLRRAKQLSDEIEQMSKEIRSNPEYKNAKETSQAALSKKAEQWAANNSAAIKADPEGFERIRKAIADINTLSDQNEASRMLDDFIAKSNAAGKAGASFADTLKARFKSLGAYLMSFASFYRVIGWIRQAVQMITQLDTALVELKKVSDESAKSYSDFMKQSFDMANEVGTTAEQIIQSTADWKRLGRSFEESKKLAQQSTVLMNVSEFQNINDATEAMVSATQAYTDVASEDIIDKLNHVGNNFAVGTSELAQGLQNAAAVLKTQGNDIDEALALLTAGNLIGQDMSKASAGIRTISLRISGTEEAKDEIADMGEDVDDFVVRTKSKTDQIIRDYTAVASNAYKGISVLDDNGNLRDTYSILLDISKIYKEIQEEDKQYGTNRAQALVEVLAGKNRSNIASSILLNGDILEQVYNESKNDSKGSAQHELETYLDSIEGKTAKLKNQIQELISTLVGSGFIKTVVDGLTIALQLVTKIVDGIGTIPTVVGAIMGVMLQRNGMGFFNYDKMAKTWSIGFSKIFEKITTNIALPKQMEAIFAKMDPNKLYAPQLEILKQQGYVIPKEMFDTQQIDNYSESVTTAGQAQEAFGVKTSGAAGLLLNFKSIAATTASTLLTMATSMIVMFAVSKLISFIGKGINSLIHQRENAIKKAEEQQEKIDEIVKKNNEIEKFQNDEKYERAIELSSKITVDNDSYKNISATNEEYDEYISLCNEIAEIYPTVVTSYDAQGNAIINLGDNAKEAREQLEGLYDASKNVKYTELQGKVDEAWKGNQIKLSDARRSRDAAKNIVDSAKNSISMLSGEESTQFYNQLKRIQTDKSVTIDTNGLNSSEMSFLQKIIMDSAKEAKLPINSFNLNEDEMIAQLSPFTQLSSITDDEWDTFYDTLYAKIWNADNEAQNEFSTKNANYEGAKNEFNQILQQQLNDELELLKVEPKFLDLDGFDDVQQAIIDQFMSLEDLPEVDSIEEWAVTNFIDPISRAFNSNNDEVKNAMATLFSNSFKDLPAEIYDQQLKTNLDIIKNFYGEDSETYRTLVDTYNFGTVTSGGGVMLNDSKSILRNLRDKYDSSQRGYIDSIGKSLKFSQLQQVWDLINDETFGGSLEDAVKQVTAKPKDIPKTDTLADVLNDESYKETADTASSHLSTLTGALETLRTEGQLTAETMVELQNAFPDLTEFTTESLNTKAFEELDAWIKTIRENMDGMSEEGLKQMQTLIQNMIDQYGDLGLSMEDIQATYFEVLGVDSSVSHEQAELVRTGFNEQVEELRNRLAANGEELDTHVLYTLVASDQFSGTADEIYNKYQDTKVTWEITVDEKKAIRDIEIAESKIQTEQAKRSAKEANGEILTPDDYQNEINILNGKVSTSTEQTNRARGKLKEALQSGEDQDTIDILFKQYQDYLAKQKDAEAEQAKVVKEQAESNANEELQNLKESNNALSDAQNKIAKAEKNGGKASKELYDTVATEQENQAEINRRLGDIFQDLANNTDNEQWKADWQEQANNYYAAAIQNESDAMEQRRIPLQNELNELQNESNEIQRDITKAEQKNQKVSKQTYRDLLANGQKQIRNLRQQQEGVEAFGDTWWDLQNDIESMQDSMFEWGQSLDRIVYDQAAALADAINTAISESASGTGLTSETINALITGFSDLSGKQFDLSDMFYNTADGVKVNTEAVRELTEAEFDMISANLADEIQTIQDKMKGTKDQTIWNSYNEQLQTLMQTQAQYFAQYEEMQKALSYNNAIEIAEGTADKGENYDNNYARLKTFKEDYENGKVGTDQFKAFTAYGDMFGRNTYEAFEAILPKFERYFTEDATEGVENFLKDLQAKGLAEYSDAEGWNMLFENEEDAARAMGMGPEFFNDMLGKIQDLGGYYAKVGSLTEYELNKQDLNAQLESALQTYVKMQQSGQATTDELKAQEKVIQSIRDQLDDNETNRENYLKDQEEKRKADFEGIQDNLKMYQDLYDKATSDEERDAIRKMAQKEVAQYGYDLKEGEIALSEKAQEDYESRFKQGTIETPLTAKEMGVAKEDRKEYKSIVGDIQNQWGKNQDLSNLIQNIRGMSADELKEIDHADGEWQKGEESLESICNILGVSYENADLLIDALAGLGLIEFPGVLDEIPDELAIGKEQLESLLSTAEKGSGAKYQIELEPDYSQMTPDQLRTQLSEIENLRIQLSPDDTEMNAYLDELEENARVQLDIQAKLGAGDFTLPEIKRLIDTGDDAGLAAELGIDMTQDGAEDQLARYKKMLQDMPQSYDMVVHIDDSQFQQLVDTVTGTPLDAEITANTDEAEGIWGKFKKAVEGNPIVQTITQFFTGNKETQKPQQTQTTTTTATATVGANASSGNKEVEKFEKNVENVNKTTGTATVQVNTDQANAKINALRNNLLLLNQLVVAPQFNESAIVRAITRTDTLIAKLQRAQSIKPSAAGTAHARGTTLSHSYAGGTQDWTVGRDEPALVNEIGQESRVRDGVWELIPGGPHVEDLQRDDIIFNAEQTADLIRTGKTARSGRLVAHANGTVDNMSAFAGLGNYKSRKKKSGGGGKNNGGGGGNNGKKNKGNGKGNKTSKALDRFNKWLGKLFDWIEVRLDRIQRQIDLSTAKAENAIGNIANGVEKIGTISTNKNKNINDAMRNISTVNGGEQYEFTKSSAKTTDGVQRVTGVKYSNIGSSDTLINNNLRGANRYFAEAEKVRKKATSGKTKIVSASDADKIIAKIQSGQINIAEYSDKQRAFIDAYKQWYDKAMDCVQAVEDLKSQLKELQQTKLDNITDEFDALVGYADAVKASSEATVDYYNSAGFAKNTPTDRAEITKQQNRQNEITGLLIQEISAYKGELINAEKVFGKNSNEYHEAQTKLEEINKSLIESQKTERELAHAGYDLSKTVRGYFIERVKTLVGKLSDIASLSEKRGTTQRHGINIAQIEDPYFEQTRYNNELILKYYEDIKEAQQEIAKEGAQINSERYEELYKTITDGESAITSLLSANEDLKDSIRTLRWKGYNEFQKQLDTINSDFEHLQGFIRDGDVLDNDAQFTDLGFAQIALIGEQMDTAEKKIRNAQGAISKLDDEYKNHTISLEKYNEELDAQIDIIQDASGAMFDYQQKLADMYIDQITAENDALQDLIKARQDALSAKKEYYDYDKTLKSKNKDIAQLQAQINALSGVTNDAGKARRAQLEAELAEKQEDLNDTLYDHSIDLQQEGYDKLSEDMQTALDNAVKLINGDQEVLKQTAALMLQQLKTNNVDEAEIIKGIVGENATTLHSSTNAVINELSGEGGVKKLLEGIGVKLGDIATLDIAGAINNRTPDASVSNIDTAISIVKDSLGNNISGQLKNIELAIGTLTVGKQGKQEVEQGNLSNGETAKGDKNIAGDVKSPTPLITKDDVPTDTSRVVNDPTASGQTSDETKNQSDLSALAKEKNATLAEDSVMAAIRTGKQRSTKITDAEKKSHVPLWEYIVKKFGYAPNSTTYKQLASALGISVKNKNKITKEEKNKILKKLKAYIKKHFSGSNASAESTFGEFKSGTKKIDEDLLAWTNENWDKNGSEMIVRAKDNAILTPLKSKDAVIPANLADNLFKWGAISPDKFITNPFMGKWSADGGSTTNTDANYSTAAQTIEMHFDSLFHIEGNVDESVMPRLESLGKSLVNDKDFQKNVIKFVTKDFVRESKKQGIR